MQEGAVADEVLRQLCPVEATLLKDTHGLLHPRVRFRSVHMHPGPIQESCQPTRPMLHSPFELLHSHLVWHSVVVFACACSLVTHADLDNTQHTRTHTHTHTHTHTQSHVYMCTLCLHTCRLAGDSFPPRVVFKVYVSRGELSVLYFSGKRVIKPGSKVRSFASRHTSLTLMPVIDCCNKFACSSH